MLLLPDPLHHPSQLSAASLLWFDEPIAVTIPATILTEDAFAVVGLVRARRPEWAPGLRFALDTWRAGHEGASETREILEPVRDRLMTVRMVYPADTPAMARADAVVNESGFAIEGLARMIDPGIAGGELLRHAFLELWLEASQNLEVLYAACSSVFAKEGFQRRLIQAYLLRFAIFDGAGANSKLLLSNERLLPVIAQFAPSEAGRKPGEAADDDVIAFEIFRHLLSPRLDLLDCSRVELLAEILGDRADELAVLKRQCERLSERLSGVPQSELFDAVTTLVRRHVADDLAALLRLARDGDFLPTVDDKNSPG